MADIDDWDDFLTSLGSPGQPSKTTEPTSPENTEDRSERAQNDADFVRGAAPQSHSAVDQQSTPSDGHEAARQAEEQRASNSIEPLLPGFKELDASNAGTHDVEMAQVAHENPSGLSNLEQTEAVGADQSGIGSALAAPHAGVSRSGTATGHINTESMHSYDVEAVLAEMAALQHSGSLPDHGSGPNAALALSRHEAEAGEERSAAEPPSSATEQSSGAVSDAHANSSATDVHAGQAEGDRTVGSLLGDVSPYPAAQQSFSSWGEEEPALEAGSLERQKEGKSEQKSSECLAAESGSREGRKEGKSEQKSSECLAAESGSREGRKDGGREHTSSECAGREALMSQVADSLVPLQPPLPLSSLRGIPQLASSRSEWSIPDAREHTEALAALVHAHEPADGLQLLAQELSASRERNRGSWPERGRPDPVRQHCMLGGQLTLEVTSTTVSSGRTDCVCSCSATLGWDASGTGSAVHSEIIVLGYRSGDVDVLFNLQDGREPLTVELRSRDREPLAPVTCMALSPCSQMSPMWLLAVAHAGSEAKIRVLDITDLVVRIEINSRGPPAPAPLADLANVAANVMERSKKFNFPVVHLAPHYIRRTLPSAAAGCPLFVVAGPEPLSHNPKAPQLLLLACRGPSSIIGPKLNLEVIPIKVDVISVYTAFFEASGAPEVEPIRMSGTWRSVESIPILQQAPHEPVPGQPQPGTPRSSMAGGAQAAGQEGRHSSADLLREVLAVVAMDDVHVCRLMHTKEPGNPVPFVRLSRLFSLRVSKGDWGGQACASWAPRPSLLWHSFPSTTRGSASGTPQPQARHKLQCTRLAVSWGATVSVFMVPYTVSLHPRGPRASADAPSAPPPTLYITPDCTCTFKLAEGEVAAKLGWMATSVSGVYKLIVLAVPEALSDGGGGQRARDIIIPTIYVYNPDSGEREEVLELGAALPEDSRLFRWLSAMNDAYCDGLNALGQALSLEVGMQRGMHAGAPWPPVQALPPADPLFIGTFHMLCDVKLVGVLPVEEGRVMLHQARHMSWQSQADVLESIANVADDKLAKWELALLTSCKHHLRDTAPVCGQPERMPQPALVQRIGRQLLQMARALRTEIVAALAVKGIPDPVDWMPVAESGDQVAGAASVLQHQAAFVATIALLVVSKSCVQLSAPRSANDPAARFSRGKPDVHYLFDAFVSVYQELCLGGFRPVVVLRFAELVMAGVHSHLPPQFLDDVAVLSLNSHASLQSPPMDGSGGALSIVIDSPDSQARFDWLEVLVLHLRDVASLNSNTLLHLCQEGLMCTALVHVGRLQQQPLLPIQSMLIHAASSEECFPGAASKARCHLAVYIASCLAMQPPPGGALAEGQQQNMAERQGFQITILAALLWADAAFFERLIAPLSLQHLHPTYPLLHMLLRLDTAHLISVFESLPLLTDGFHCGSDEMGAVVAAYRLPELCRRAPRAVTSLRQSVMTAFATLLPCDTTAEADLTSTVDSKPADAAHTLGTVRQDAVRVLRFVGGHIQRVPPAVLPKHLVVSCMLALCKPWLPDQPREREELLSVFVDAFDPLEQPDAESTSAERGGVDCSDGIQVLRTALQEKGLFPVAAKLERRMGDVAAYLQNLWRHCKLVGDCWMRLRAVQSEAAPQGHFSVEQVSEFHDIKATLLRCAPECVSSTAAWDAGNAQQMAEAVRCKAADLLKGWVMVVQGLLRSEQQEDHDSEIATATKKVLLQRFVAVRQLEALLKEPLAEEHSLSSLTALLIESLDAPAATAILNSDSWSACGAEEAQFQLLAHILRTSQDSSSGLQARCLTLFNEASTALLFARLCCRFWEAGVVQLLRTVKSLPPKELQALLHDHCNFEGLALLHSASGESEAAVDNAELHIRAALVDLRTFAASLLGSVNCSDGCTGHHTCAAGAVVQASLGSAADGQLRERVAPKLQDQVQRGQKLSREVKDAISALAGYWDSAESGVGDSGLQAAHVRWLLLCLLSEVAWGLVCEGKGDAHASDSVCAVPDQHARAVLGSAWQHTILELTHEVVRTCVQQDDAGIAALESVMDELAQGAGEGGSNFWGHEAAKWAEIVGRPGATARIQHVADEVRCLQDCARSKRTCWLVSLRYLEKILSAQRLRRRVRESLNAVMTKEFFDVEAQWTQAMHQPQLLQAEKLI